MSQTWAMFQLEIHFELSILGFIQKKIWATDWINPKLITERGKTSVHIYSKWTYGLNSPNGCSLDNMNTHMYTPDVYVIFMFMVMLVEMYHEKWRVAFIQIWEIVSRTDFPIIRKIIAPHTRPICFPMENEMLFPSISTQLTKVNSLFMF